MVILASRIFWILYMEWRKKLPQYMLHFQELIWKSGEEGAIASEFEPRTEFEKQMASIVGDNKLMEAHQKDGAQLLELDKVNLIINSLCTWKSCNFFAFFHRGFLLLSMVPYCHMNNEKADDHKRKKMGQPKRKMVPEIRKS